MKAWSAWLCVSWVTAAVIPATSRAYTFVVRPDGSGDYPLIQDAIDAAEDGDVIELTDGTFTGSGNRNINYLGKAITVRSRSGDPSTCIIDCELLGRGFTLSSSEGPTSVLEGVTITNGYANFGGGMYCGGSSPTVTRCTFLANEGIGRPGGGGGMYCSGASPRLTDCAFAGNIGSLDGGGGMYCAGSHAAPTLLRCTFARNLAPFVGGSAMSCAGGSSPTLIGCTLSQNEAGIYYGSDVFCQGSSPTIRNTIIAFGSGAAVWCFDAGSQPNLTCCDVYGNLGGDWVGCIEEQADLNANFSADPLFCDAPYGDYTLDAGSPCLAGHHPHGEDCGLIGAWDVGCGGSVSTVEVTWGRIKEQFRK